MRRRGEHLHAGRGDPRHRPRRFSAMVSTCMQGEAIRGAARGAARGPLASPPPPSSPHRSRRPLPAPPPSSPHRSHRPLPAPPPSSPHRPPIGRRARALAHGSTHHAGWSAQEDLCEHTPRGRRQPRGEHLLGDVARAPLPSGGRLIEYVVHRQLPRVRCRQLVDLWTRKPRASAGVGVGCGCEARWGGPGTLARSKMSSSRTLAKIRLTRVASCSFSTMRCATCVASGVRG